MSAVSLINRYLSPLLLSFGFVFPACGEVTVSKTFATDIFQQQVDIGAGQYWTLPLASGNVGDVYDVQVDLGNAIYKDISAFVTDEGNLQRFMLRQPYRAEGRQKNIAPFAFRTLVRSPGQYYLVLDNTFAMFIKKRVAVGVKLTSTLSDEAIGQMQSSLERGYNGLKQRFVFPDFNICDLVGKAMLFLLMTVGISLFVQKF